MSEEVQNIRNEDGFMFRIIRRISEFNNFTQTIINIIVLFGMFGSMGVYLANQSKQVIETTVSKQITEFENNINNRFTAFENNTNAKLDAFDEKLMPLVRAEQNSMILNINKQALKIKEAEEDSKKSDIKIMDIEKALNDYDLIKEKTVLLKMNYDIILNWYRKNS